MQTLKALRADEIAIGPAFFQRFLEGVMGCFDMPFGIVSTFEDGRFHLLARVGCAAAETLEGRPLAEMFAAELVSARGPVFCPWVAHDPALRRKPIYAELGLEAYLAAPVRVDGAIFGSISLAADTPRKGVFDAADIGCLDLCAEALGDAVARSRRAAEHARIEQQQREATTLFATAFRHAPIGMALVGLDGRWLKVNPAACRLLGYDEAELLGRDFQSITYPADLAADLDHVEALRAGKGDLYSMEKRYVRKDGRALWARLSVALVRDDYGEPRYFVSQIQDIDAERRLLGELEAANQKLLQLVNVDPLTALLSRRALRARLDQELDKAVRTRAPLSFLMADVDYFKRYNDNFGHLAGDAALRQIADTLKGVVRADDAVGRFGGEEFLILLPGVAEPGARAIAERMREEVAQARQMRDTVTISIGVHAFVPQGEEKPVANALIAKADAALYAAKRNGRNRVEAA